jgi:hypothetical protein
MNDIHLTIIIILLSFIVTIIDISTDYSQCYKTCPNIFIILFLHAIIWIFTHFGCFYNNKKILILYLLCFIFLPIHWLLNNNRCIVTEYVNKICGFDINRRYDRILYLKNGFIYSILIKLICILIAINKLTKCDFSY